MVKKRSQFPVFGSMVALALLNTACGGDKPGAGAPKAIPVQLQTLETSSVTDSNEFVGNLVATKFVELAPKIDGRILRIYAQWGQQVNEGDPILLLEPTQQQENVNAAVGNLNIQRSNFQVSEANLRTSESERDAAQSFVTTQEANLARAIADLANSQEVLKTREADLKRAQANLNLAQINFKRSQFLVETGVQPQQDLDNRTTQLEDAKANTEAAQKTVQAAKATVQANQSSVSASRSAVQQAKDNYQAAVQRVNASRATVSSQKGAIEQAQGQLGATSQELIYNRVLAPVSGVVGNLPLQIGDFVRTGQSFTTITNNTEFELDINVPVERYNDLRIGLPVEIVRSDGQAGEVGRISFISPTANRSDQSILAKVIFKNDGNLRNNQYVRVRIIWDRQPGFLIPTTAVTSIGAQQFIFVAQPKNAQSDSKEGTSGTELVARQTPVVLGGIQGQSYQVISGVKAGERVAVSRILELRDGMAIEPASAATPSNNGGSGAGAGDKQKQQSSS
ncbi:efflux RND transporter periplasmic adaptor subunit [Synechocystis salina]|uniref:Efflux RND transporter periplasmic adaptor subunit n=1 Tax=Synechocystis salina LEGE 00031 TaxID=1828736 RepID=A0ABR9VVI7_9SYNC|nr:efflux RND transporter periplasmic adaptor subunit [Synechocystis salina]MBE9241771.1 efflux RND transporter periplasmic adaptor subunit [Synechocystis salina LEGE 00041]MBE9255056.1 efflux RND transporter periplasmic adaptor subunit [Synechocystis salina LEGE 00031]